MSHPAISCVVNTYNHADLLPRALQSVYNEIDADAPPFEVIVVDDASTDDTSKVLRQWAEFFDERAITFIPLRMGENSGYQCVPKNMGIEMSRGDYIRFLDDDNEWTRGSLRVLYNAIREGDVWPDAVYGRREYVRDEGAPETAPNGAPLYVGESPLIEHDPRILALGPMLNYIDTGDMLISRGAFWWAHEWTGMMWNTNRRRFGDWELVTRMSMLNELEHVAPVKFRAVDAIVQRYHWTGSNLQLTRPLVETPSPVEIRKLEADAKK